jgi:hypothetical protein
MTVLVVKDPGNRSCQKSFKKCCISVEMGRRLRNKVGMLAVNMKV